MTTAIRTGVVTIVGNPRRGSRTAAAATLVAARIAEHLRSGPPHVIDLALTSTPLHPDAAQQLAPALTRVATAAAVVVASPTYRASYTGLLKSFLDLIPSQGLQGAVAVPMMTLRDRAHSLVADYHLRPVLQELGASLPTRSLTLTEDLLGDPSSAVDDWWDEALPALGGIGDVTTSITWNEPLARAVGHGAH